MAFVRKLRKPISIMFKIKFISYDLVITRKIVITRKDLVITGKDLVITRKVIVITRKLSPNYEKIKS